MGADLGTADGQVHAQADSVIRFWLVETPAERRFAREGALDAAICDRFGALRDQVWQARAAGWRASPRTQLAAIILLDQFSRNLFRDDPRAYQADPLARALAREALAKGWGEGMTEEERQFLHMPFMHSERMEDQLLSLRLFGAEDQWAHAHAAQIARFGRFPQRNAALGRASTPAELAFLTEPGSRF
ncbi:DUF924 family protein [Sphingomonas quercus]|uniref:DUF924 domain-containing protein n=1 Tax=Sphingomonas quercus TaxID=2842451 RepID=A0ABS6BKM9_9SPHN|nr:DUF924 family protein [Sphingomonas quercus]MBU3078371.1 DUF924 domain-containing protein [Sphingomonas quercus]